MLPVSLDCPFFMPLRYSLTFIYTGQESDFNTNVVLVRKMAIQTLGKTLKISLGLLGLAETTIFVLFCLIQRLSHIHLSFFLFLEYYLHITECHKQTLMYTINLVSCIYKLYTESRSIQARAVGVVR